jgi:hypothetical protein
MVLCLRLTWDERSLSPASWARQPTGTLAALEARNRSYRGVGGAPRPARKPQGRYLPVQQLRKVQGTTVTEVGDLGAAGETIGENRRLGRRVEGGKQMLCRHGNRDLVVPQLDTKVAGKAAAPLSRRTLAPVAASRSASAFGPGRRDDGSAAAPRAPAA